MEERGSVALSNEVLHTIRFSSGVEMSLLTDKGHIYLVVALFHDQTDFC